MGREMKTVVAQITKSCDTYLQNNPKTLPLPPVLVKPVQHGGSYLGEDWQIDSTQMPRSQGYKYLLLMVDTFTSCIKAFPIWTEWASKVTKNLLKEIIPWLDGITDSMDMGLGGLRELVMDRDFWRAVAHEVSRSRTQLSNRNELNWKSGTRKGAHSHHYYSTEFWKF